MDLVTIRTTAKSENGNLAQKLLFSSDEGVAAVAVIPVVVASTTTVLLPEGGLFCRGGVVFSAILVFSPPLNFLLLLPLSMLLHCS